MQEAEREGKDKELLCRAALACTEGVGPATFEELLNAYGTCFDAIHEARRRSLLSLPRMAAKTVDAILRLRDELPRWEMTLIELEKDGIRVVSEADAEYPRAFRAAGRPPPILFVHGELKEDDQRGLAIVGTTRPTEQGRETAVESAKRAARRGRTVISGFARGIDSAAHLGAISAGGRTVAFPATGLRKVYPTMEFRHPGVIARSGALVSPFPPCQDWNVGGAMRRNRRIAAMSSGVFVVESVRDGGAVYTATVAQSLGKPVFALSKKRLGKETEGNRQLLESGATPVRCFADVERMIAARSDGRTSVRQP